MVLMLIKTTQLVDSKGQRCVQRSCSDVLKCMCLSCSIDGPKLWQKMTQSFGYLTMAGYGGHIFPVIIGETGSFMTSVSTIYKPKPSLGSRPSCMQASWQATITTVTNYHYYLTLILGGCSPSRAANLKHDVSTVLYMCGPYI